MKKAISILGAVAFLNIGCSQSIDYVEPMYVSPIKYEKITCKQLKEEFPYKKISCKELKEKLLYISPTEYEKISCKQLHEQLIKINKRLDAKSQIKTERATSNVFAVVYVVMHAGVPYLMSDSDSDSDSKSVYPEVSESKILKAAYKTLKDTAKKKNCSFTVDIR